MAIDGSGGFSGYPVVKLEARLATHVEDYNNTFAILASRGYEAFQPKPSIVQQLQDWLLGLDLYSTGEINFVKDSPDYDPLIGSQGIVMLPRVYDTENNYLMVKYKREHGQPVREGNYDNYQASDGQWIAGFEQLSELDASLGVDIDTRFEPADFVLDGVDYSKSSHQWQEVWAERAIPRVWPPAWEDSGGKPLYYTDYYSVKLHQDRYKEKTNASDPLLDPPVDADGNVIQPDLHFCIRRYVPFPDMPAYRTATASDYNNLKNNSDVNIGPDDESDDEPEEDTNAVFSASNSATNEERDNYLDEYGQEMLGSGYNSLQFSAAPTTTTSSTTSVNNSTTVLEDASKPMHGFWVEITRLEASVSYQAKDLADKQVVTDNEDDIKEKVVFDLAYEEPFISVGFGMGSSNHPRIELVFPQSRKPYAVFWNVPAEGNIDRTSNTIRDIDNAFPVMASNFAVFVYVMLGEVAVRVTTGDLSTVIWEDKIANTDPNIEDPEHKEINIDSAHPYVRGKNMRCTVGMSRVKFKRHAVLYTPTLYNFSNDPQYAKFKLQGAYEVLWYTPTSTLSSGRLSLPVARDSVPYFPEEREPTVDTATNNKLNTPSHIPGTAIYADQFLYRDSTISKRYKYFWKIIMCRDMEPFQIPNLSDDVWAWQTDTRVEWDGTSNEFISPLIFYVEGRINPVIQTFPKWDDITDILIDANIDQSAPDFFSIDQYMNLSLRDEDIVVTEGAMEVSMNSFQYFQSAAREVRLSAGWYTEDPDPDQPAAEHYDDSNTESVVFPPITTLFTGFVSNSSLEWQRPINIINLTVVTLAERMKNIPILQSPYYDGQETGKVIKDLVRRGQMIEQIVTNDEDEDEDEEEEEVNVKTEPWVRFYEDGVLVPEFSENFRLGVGRDFQSAQYKFDGGQTIMECIKAVAGTDGARCYAHPVGYLVYSKFSQKVFGTSDTVATFYSYPSEGGAEPHSEYYTLFDGLSFERTPHDAVNDIMVFTVDRDTRKIATSHVYKPITDDLERLAEVDTRDVGYIKTVRIDNPALGDLRSARYTALQLSQFMFYPPRRASFSCWGHPELLPLQFVEVRSTEQVYDKGLGIFLITSISSRIRKDADEFVYEADYELEYVGNPAKLPDRG